MKTLMKYPVALLSAAMLSLPGLPIDAQAVTLTQCLSMAYDNYPQVKEKALIEASRDYDLSNAATAWLPQLNVTGKASWQSDVVEMPFDIPNMKFDIPHDQYGVTADISQQIWDGGATAAKRKLTGAAADVKRNQLEVNLYALRSKVQGIYLGIILLEKQIELNGLLRSSLERSLEEVQHLSEAGLAGRSDIDQIKVNLLSCDQQKQSLETERKAYLRMLGLLTAQDMSDAELVVPVEIGTRQLSENPLITRPELDLYDAQVRQVEAQKKQLSASLSPRLNLNLQAGYGRPGLNMLSGSFDPYFVAGLKLQWNFGSFYTIRNDRRKADLDSRRIELSRESFMLNTSLEAVQKRSEIEKDADVLLKDKEIIELRRSIRETAEQQYREGVLTMNEYLSLLDEEFKARLSYNVHNVQYIMALLDLENTIGY